MMFSQINICYSQAVVKWKAQHNLALPLIGPGFFTLENFCQNSPSVNFFIMDLPHNWAFRLPTMESTARQLCICQAHLCNLLSYLSIFRLLEPPHPCHPCLVSKKRHVCNHMCHIWGVDVHLCTLGSWTKNKMAPKPDFSDGLLELQVIQTSRNVVWNQFELQRSDFPWCQRTLS